jgi:YcxB-like protein
MAEQRTNAPDERIFGEVAIARADLQLAGADATADSRVYEALNWCGLALLLVGAALNLRDPSSTLWHAAMYLSIPLVIYGIIAGRRQRALRARTVRARIAEVHGGEEPVIHYHLDLNCLEMQSGSSSTRYTWSSCQGVDEGRHSFLLYFDRVVPDVLFKRAFAAEELSHVRDC